jgi:hypothetical protein
MVPVMDRLKNDPTVPVFTDCNSKSVVVSESTLVTLRLRKDGGKKLKCDREGAVAVSIDMTISAEMEAMPELDLQRALLSDSHTEYWAAVCSTFNAADVVYKPKCIPVRATIWEPEETNGCSAATGSAAIKRFDT